MQKLQAILIVLLVVACGDNIRPPEPGEPDDPVVTPGDVCCVNPGDEPDAGTPDVGTPDAAEGCDDDADTNCHWHNGHWHCDPSGHMHNGHWHQGHLNP